MEEEVKKATATKKAVPKVEKKVASVEKTATSTKESDDTNIVDAATDKIVDALNTLSESINEAREKGNTKGHDVINSFGGNGKFNDLVADLAGYMGEAAAVGFKMGTTPMSIMADAAKGAGTIAKDAIDTAKDKIAK